MEQQQQRRQQRRNIPSRSIRIRELTVPKKEPRRTAIVTPPQEDDRVIMSSSKSIPIRSSLRRTESEVQLCENEAMADYRDYCMYQRIANGTKKKKQRGGDGVAHGWVPATQDFTDSSRLGIVRGDQDFASTTLATTTTPMQVEDEDEEHNEIFVLDL